MLERLFPREGHEFYDYFEQHADKTLEAVEALRSLVQAPEQSAEWAARVKKAEHEGDEITHRTIALLHQVYLAPIERGDIHRLISRLDDILDLVDSTAERISLYEIRTMEADAEGLVVVLQQAMIEVRKLVGMVRNLRDTETILRACKEVGRHEEEGDRILHLAMARLFEQNQDPIHVIMWKEILGFLEDAIDRCKDVADVMEGIAIGYA